MMRIGLSILVPALSLCVTGCGPKDSDAAVNAQAANAAAPRTEFIGLPNGATISVEPGSVGQQMATYLASADPAPRSFQIGGDQFADWSATARPAVRAMVPGLVELLKSYPQVRLRIIGHTDNVGEKDENQTLSEARAETAKRHLAEAGIAETRIEAAGRGMDEPIADNDTIEGRARNRRIELVVIAK